MNEIKTFDDRKKELLELGKKNKFVTYEQLANALKGLELDADSLDDLYNMFSENQIAVVTEEEAGQTGGVIAKHEENVSEILLDDNELVKDLTINDPVRMYLK